MEEKNLQGTPMYFLVGGRNADRAIVFLHPAFGDHACFDEQIAYFSKCCKVFAPDLLGHGKSIGKGKISDMADWLARMLEQENVCAANIVGVSLGAVIAQDFANKYPNKVASLCCIGGYDINDFDPHLQKGNSAQQGK